MQFLPLFHSLQSRTVLIVGGGEVALRKARLLQGAGARLRVVAPQLHPELPALAAEVHIRSYAESDLASTALVIAATNEPALNASVSAHAQARGIPVNVVDSPALCSAIFPAVVDRSPLVVAVSSGGHAPVLARLVRAKIETWLPSQYGQLAGLAQQFRTRVQRWLPGVRQRRLFWERVFQGPIAEAVFAGRASQAQQMLQDALHAAAPVAQGEVYLIGAGPGDPDLLTFRALRLMQQADVVVFEPAVPPAVVELCRRDADRVALAPRPGGQHPCGSEPLATLARPGRRVVLLVAGDASALLSQGLPQALAKQGILYHLVPGVSFPAPVSP